MAHRTTILLATLATLAVADCSGVKKAGDQAALAPGDGTVTDQDTENEPASQPQMVAGAFLTGVGPAAGAPGAPAAGTSAGLADEDVYGAGLFAAESKKKFEGELTAVYVDLIDANGEVTHPTLVAAPADSPWHVYFTLPAGAMQSYVAVVFIGKVASPNGIVVPVVTSTTSIYTFTPVALTPAEVTAIKPVTVDDTPPANDGLGTKIATQIQASAARLPLVITSPADDYDFVNAVVAPLPVNLPTLIPTATGIGTSVGMGTTVPVNTATMNMTGTNVGIGTMSPGIMTMTMTATSTNVGIGTMSPGTMTMTMTSTSTNVGIGTMSPGTMTMTSTTTVTSTSVGMGSGGPSM